MGSLIKIFVDIGTQMIAQGGHWAIIVLSLLGSACIPIPNELVMLFAGFEAKTGSLRLVAVIATGTIGNLAGCVGAYYMGKSGGRPLIHKYGKYVFISHKKLVLAEHFFDKYGEGAVFVSRLTPIIRAAMSLPAGVANMNLTKFVAYSFLGSLIWCAGLAWLGYALGANWQRALTVFNRLDYVVLIVVAASLVGWIVLRRVTKKRAAAKDF